MNLENLIKQGVKYVDIGFENCECMIIPIENIIDFNSFNDEIKCVIKSSDKIKYDAFGTTGLSAIQRLAEYNDIVSMEFRDNKMKLIHAAEIQWYDPEPDNPYITPQSNEYQKIKMINKDMAELSINKENRLEEIVAKFNLKEILKLNKEMIIKDENNNTYKVNKRNNKSYIDNITLEMLESTYTIA